MLRPNRTASRSNDQLPFDVVYDYGYDAVMRSIEDSLQRLGLARIDIAYIHDLTPQLPRRRRTSGTFATRWTAAIAHWTVCAAKACSAQSVPG